MKKEQRKHERHLGNIDVELSDPGETGLCEPPVSGEADVPLYETAGTTTSDEDIARLLFKLVADAHPCSRPCTSLIEIEWSVTKNLVKATVKPDGTKKVYKGRLIHYAFTRKCVRFI